MPSKRHSLRLALLQYPMTSLAQTQKRVIQLLDQVAHKKPDYVVLPEMWLGGSDLKKNKNLLCQLYDEGHKQLEQWCQTHKIGAIFSEFIFEQGHYYNAACLLNPTSLKKQRYHKKHLFRLGREHLLFSAGTQMIRPFSTPWGKVGCLVCYDLRFPELSRELAHKGAFVLIVPAQWPKARREHWLTLLRARAIENQVFVVGVNRLGVKEGQTFSGDSVVFDPWGDCLLQLGAKDSLGLVTLDLAAGARLRQQYPFFKERQIHSIVWKQKKR